MYHHHVSLSLLSSILICSFYNHTFLAAKASGNQGLFNNAAQAWNHSFYWECMKSNGGGVPTGN